MVQFLHGFFYICSIYQIHGDWWPPYSRTEWSIYTNGFIPNATSTVKAKAKTVTLIIMSTVCIDSGAWLLYIKAKYVYV